MKVVPTDIRDVLVLEPDVFSDDRGVFFESFNQAQFENITGQKIGFVQDNHSSSRKGVLRGLHYQLPPAGQGKLLRVVRGEIFDVAVDIRRGSSSFGRWVSMVLNEDNKKQLWIPEGFAHGFLVLSDVAEVLYKTTNYWSSQHERTIRWDDRSLNISWPHAAVHLSMKDRHAVMLHESEIP